MVGLLSVNKKAMQSAGMAFWEIPRGVVLFCQRARPEKASLIDFL